MPYNHIYFPSNINPSCAYHNNNNNNGPGVNVYLDRYILKLKEYIQASKTRGEM